MSDKFKPGDRVIYTNDGMYMKGTVLGGEIQWYRNDEDDRTRVIFDDYPEPREPLKKYLRKLTKLELALS